MDADIVKLVRLAVGGDWEAVGLLLDRLEDMQDKRQEQLLAVLGNASESIERQRKGGFCHPREVAIALGNVRSWLRLAFWAELLDGGPKALLASLAALEKAHGCNEGPHPQMSMGATYAYPMGMQAPASEMWQEPPHRPQAEILREIRAAERQRQRSSVQPLSDSLRAMREPPVEE